MNLDIIFLVGNCVNSVNKISKIKINFKVKVSKYLNIFRLLCKLCYDLMDEIVWVLYL